MSYLFICIVLHHSILRDKVIGVLDPNFERDTSHVSNRLTLLVR